MTRRFLAAVTGGSSLIMFTVLVLIILFEPIVHCIFDYKRSFKPPILDEANKIPFFEISGNSIPDNSRIRLVPSIQGQKGLIYSKYPVDYKWWEILVHFKIFGPNRIGADGMAIWYTQNKGSIGPAFGNLDKWSGLGIMMDSYDNDNNGANPEIAAILNNETFNYDHDMDGEGQKIGKCVIDFRNSPHPSQLRIQYYKNNLTVWYLHGLVEDKTSPVLSKPLIEGDGNFAGLGVICLKVSNVYLPEKGFFGLSAMTGGFGDDHDIYSFHTFSIQEDAQKEDSGVSKDKTDKKANEYEEMIKEFEREQEKFIKMGGKVPDLISTQYLEKDLAQDAYTKDLRTLFSIHNQLSDKIELIGKMMLDIQKQITDINTKDSNNLPQILVKQLADIQTTTRYLKESILQTYKDTREIATLKSYMQNIKSDLRFLSDQIHLTKKASSSCIGFGYTFILLIAQFILLVAYNTYLAYYRNIQRNFV